MDLQTLYGLINEKIINGRLTLNPELGEYTFSQLFFTAGTVVLEQCLVSMQSERMLITGKAELNGWNSGKPFDAMITCWENRDKIEYQADFSCTLHATLGVLFGNISPTLISNENGISEAVPLIEGFPISNPTFTFCSGEPEKNIDTFFCFKLSAETSAPLDSLWERYPGLAWNISRITGFVDSGGRFEFEIPAVMEATGLFNFVGSSILLRNGITYGGNDEYDSISQAGLELKLKLKHVGEVGFEIPLFLSNSDWSLRAYFPNGLGVSDIINLIYDLFNLGGSLSELGLPSDTPIDRFKLYNMKLLTQGDIDSLGKLNLSMRYLTLDFALDKPWILPLSNVSFEDLGIGFQITFGNAEWGNLLTASAAGTLLLTLGKYDLRMSVKIDLPELDFLAQLTLSEQSDNADSPMVSDLADTFGVTLPAEIGKAGNLLAQLTVSGSGSSRYLAIDAEVRDLLTFSLGGLKISLSSIVAGTFISTSDFSFYVHGILDFGEDDRSFSLYLNADYNNSAWIFAGGLLRGEVSLGYLLNQMFNASVLPDDIVDLALSGLDLMYDSDTKLFTLFAEMTSKWNITILGQPLSLTGAIQIYSEAEKETDVSALVKLDIAKFSVLAQVDHIQSDNKREFLFRVEYDKVYLQAAWTIRGGNNILSVSLGGTTLGALVEMLVNRINPNRRVTLEGPWSVLNKIELSRFLLEFNIDKKEALFAYRADLNIAGLMRLDTVGLRYDIEASKLYFVLTGMLLGITYGDDDPITWDALDGQPPENSADNDKKFELTYLGLGQHLHTLGVLEADSISDAIKALKDQLDPSSVEQGVSYDSSINWLFGVDFTVNGMINVKLVLNDPVLYGLLVTVTAKDGSALSMLNGFGMELMCKRVSDQVYMFRGELLVPEKYRSFSLGAVSVTLGRIRGEIYTNGGFYIDLGFPHGMDFSDSFSLQWGIYTGRGGFYFGVMKDISRPNLPETTKGNFSPIVVLGVGLSVGLGRSFDLGIVKGGVSVEVFGIFEGVLAIFHDKESGKESTYYYVSATAGIAGRLYLSVDFKIITVQASAELSASAALAIQAYRASLVKLDLALKLEASIKILFIKIKFSFSFKQSVTFTMGKDELAPWDGTNANILSDARSVPFISMLTAREMDTRNIHLQLIPMFYMRDPASDNLPGNYGAAFMMMMDSDALSAWAELLTDWVLSHFSEQTLTRQQIEGLSTELADTLTYDVLDEFLSLNVSVTYSVHWKEQAEYLKTVSEEAGERYVFPMLPSLTLSFGDGENTATVNYWEDIPVDEKYFSALTKYFYSLNPDPSAAPDSADKLSNSEGLMPIAKAFFQDYFQMFLRELIGRIRAAFQHITTKNCAKSAADSFGVPVEEILRQNTKLQFKDGVILKFDDLTYTVSEHDTLQSISDKFTFDDPNSFWHSVKNETYLIETGRSFSFGDAVFDNSAAGLTLEEAAAFLFVRFYEDLAPEDMYYAGDTVRLNDGIDADWEETLPNGRQLTLPGWDKPYHTLRGDTPDRLGRFLNLCGMKNKGAIPEWERFYDDICERNEGQQGQVPQKVYFHVDTATVLRDRNLAELSARIYPDLSEEDAPKGAIFGAEILKVNSVLHLSGVSFALPESDTFTVSDVLNAVPCTLEELCAATADDDYFAKGQMLSISDAQRMSIDDIKYAVVGDVDSVGAMLSRFLLQGLRIPAPDAEGKGANTEQIAPLYRVLQQMFDMDDCQSDRILSVDSTEACSWVEREQLEVTLKWTDIDSMLPKGNFDFCKYPYGRLEKLDDFISVPQYFSVDKSDKFVCRGSNLAIRRIPDAVSEILAKSTVPPQALNGQGQPVDVSWGCMIPCEVRPCEQEAIFTVYGADAQERLVLHELLGRNDLKLHLVYQASKLSKGGQSFIECQWSAKDSFLVKTNLSVETHMGPQEFMMTNTNDDYEYLATIGQEALFLRLLWECSTIGGGYYLQLKTNDGLTLPDDIFDENGSGRLWIIMTGEKNVFPLNCRVNCFVTDDITAKEALTLVTNDPGQQIMQPVFPVGCVGLETSMPVPPDDDSEQDLLQSMFQIVGYQIEGVNGCNSSQSPVSAPTMPVKDDDQWPDRWLYKPVVPVYRYIDGEKTEEENPYAAVGKTLKIALEIRDILGNAVMVDREDIKPFYNDVLIGLGQWPDMRASYALTGEAGAAILRLTMEYVPSEQSDEKLAYQKRAAKQLACDGIQVEIASPVNDQSFSFAEMSTGGTDYLSLLREYAVALADAMQSQAAALDPLVLDFPLGILNSPMRDDAPFELSTLVTVRRTKYADVNPSMLVESRIPPYFPGESNNETDEVNLTAFCREAQRVLPGLHLAQTASESAALYGVTDGYLGKIDISLYDYQDGTGGGSIMAPEYYALKPLNNGFLSRDAMVYPYLQDLQKASYVINMPDVDMEILAKSFLEDIEILLLPAHLQKAAVYCGGFEGIERLIDAKDRLAEAIAEQMEPLRQGGQPVDEDLKKKIADRLRRSLKEGYNTDIAARLKLSFEPNDFCRLTAAVKQKSVEAMETAAGGIEITAGKLEKSADGVYLFCKNTFTGRNSALTVELVCPELEYDIEPDKGYESSRWLRFVDPIYPGRQDANTEAWISSQIDLPNPLKLCPSVPAIRKHSGEVSFGEAKELFGLSNDRIGWKYTLLGSYRYMEQDTFYVRIVFKQLHSVSLYANKGLDLFDILSEYSINREEMWNALTGEEQSAYGDAYNYFSRLASRCAGVWESWISGISGSPVMAASNDEVTFSCTLQGKWAKDRWIFEMTPTGEGKAFIEQMGIAMPVFEASDGAPGEEMQFSFTINGLPVFRCAEAQPYVQIVRNQNLLVYDNGDTKASFPVNEDFIYRTQEVSLPLLSVVGEYTDEHLLGTVEAGSMSLDVMKQAVSLILDSLQMENYDLKVGVTASYYYGLSKGKNQPRVILPATLVLPKHIVNTEDLEALKASIGDDLYDWFKETEPDTNRCGLMFDVKIFDGVSDRLLLHCTSLTVEFDLP